MQKATDIHLVSQMIVGDNDIDTHATSNDEDFNRYITEIMKKIMSHGNVTIT